MVGKFGTLTKKNKQIYNIKTLLNQDTLEIEYLFGNAKKQLERMTVIEAERQIALDNLHEMAQELKSRRLQYNQNAKLNYFTK
ncbi:hypothetical protein IJ182_10825 [bacterium]|nr:hypothetical protein [bacterium]